FLLLLVIGLVGGGFAGLRGVSLSVKWPSGRSRFPARRRVRGQQDKCQLVSILVDLERARRAFDRTCGQLRGCRIFAVQGSGIPPSSILVDLGCWRDSIRAGLWTTGASV